jgi:hypothetical protein
MATVKLLPHQAALVQAPYIYYDIRYFFLIAGYAAGKTSALVYATLQAIRYFSGKKDSEGNMPKIGVCGITLTFLKKTFSGALVSALKMHRSKYLYDKAHNVIYVAGVELHLTPIINEEDIFGFSWCIEENSLVTTVRGDIRIKDIQVGDEVLTRQGYKKVTHKYNSGVKDVYEVHAGERAVWATKEHRFFTVDKDYVEAQELTNTDRLLTLHNDTFTTELASSGKDINTEDNVLKSCRRKQSVTYDITVEDANEFFANGILVHNCAAVVDELDELSTYAAPAVVKSIGDRCRQVIPGCRSPFILFATTSQGLKGTYQIIQSFLKIGMNFFLIRGRTKDNTYLPKEYVDAQYKIYNEKETKCLLEGEFLSIDSGLVYPDYDPSKNRLEYDLCDSIQESETIYIGQDFNTGFNKAAAIVCREGSMYVVKIYSFPDVRRAPEVFRYDFPKNRIKWIPDATFNHHLPEFKKELRQNRIETVYRRTNPRVNDRSFLINKLFYTERLYIGGSCADLDSALTIRQKDKDTGLPAKGKGETAPDHITDPLEYAASYCVSWLREFKDLYKVTMGRRLEKRLEAGLTTEEEERYSEDIKNTNFESFSLQ